MLFFYFGPKTVQQNFRIFRFFFCFCIIITVSIQKVLVSAKCIFARLDGIKKKLRKKNWSPDSKFFTFFKPKNDLFSIFEPPPLIFRPKARKKLAQFSCLG